MVCADFEAPLAIAWYMFFSSVLKKTTAARNQPQNWIEIKNIFSCEPLVEDILYNEPKEFQ